MSVEPDRRSGPGGVIHDIGYRPYTGPRLSTGSVARSLFTTGLLNAYGIGRSGKAKVLPVLLSVVMVIPAVILVAVMVLVGLGEGFLDYAAYPLNLSLVLAVFVAAQAPVLFSRDLQSGAIVLYLARPLSVTAFAMTRWLSLFVAILIFITLPVLTLYIGALAAEADVSDHTSDFLVAWVGVVLLSALLATLAGLVSAYTTRRALAVGATIVTLLVSLGVATAVQAIADETGNDLVAQLAGLLSPFTLVDGITYSLLDGTSVYPAAPENAGLGLLFLIVAVALVAGGCWLLIRRYRKQASR